MTLPLIQGASNRQIVDKINELNTFRFNAEGSVARTLQSKVEDAVSIFDFPAQGDGVTDDMLALQNATSHMSDGETLRLIKDKTYRISNGFGVTNNISIEGNGATIKYDASATTALFFSQTKNIYSSLSIAITKNTPSFIIPTGVTVEAGDTVILNTDAYWYGTYRQGIIAYVHYISGTTAFISHSSHLTFTANNLEIYKSFEGQTIKDLTIDCRGTQGIFALFFFGMVGGTVENLKIIGDENTYAGLSVTGVDITIKNNIVNGFNDLISSLGYGITYNGNDISVENNRVHGGRHCLVEAGRKFYSYGLRVHNNTVSQSPTGSGYSAPIDVHANTVSVDIQGNNIKAAGTFGIQARGGVSYIYNNEIENVGSTSFFKAIHLFESVITKCVVEKNVFTDHVGNGRLLGVGVTDTASHGKLIIHNNESNNSAFTMDLPATAFEYIEVTDNRFYECDDSAILLVLSQVDNVRIKGNHIEYAYGLNAYGIDLDITTISNPGFITENTILKASSASTATAKNIAIRTTNNYLIENNRLNATIEDFTATFTWLPKGNQHIGAGYSGWKGLQLRDDGLWWGTQPSAYSWVIGDKIAQITPTIDGNNMIKIGWVRLTTGSAHVSGIDWAQRYESSLSPAT